MNLKVFVTFCCITFSGIIRMCSQDSHFGFFYSYGAYFNTHPTNNRIFKPSDGSAAGCYYHLDNGIKALGFRAAFAWRSNDVEFPIENNLDVINNLKSLELKLQCILPVSSRNSFALGIAPRLTYNSRFSKVYHNSAGHITYEEQITMSGAGIDLNALNSALCMSWFLRFNDNFHFAVNLDQDMLTLYRSNAAFVPSEFAEPVAFNARLTSLTGSLILNFN